MPKSCFSNVRPCLFVVLDFHGINTNIYWSKKSMTGNVQYGFDILDMAKQQKDISLLYFGVGSDHPGYLPDFRVDAEYIGLFHNLDQRQYIDVIILPYLGFGNCKADVAVGSHYFNDFIVLCYIQRI